MDSVKPHDPFPVDHRVLHLGGDGPRSWGNLGAWAASTDYAAAAEALAGRVIRAAAVEPGHRVLDAGCGWGQQSLELVERYGAAQVIAVDVSELAIAALHRSVRRRGLEGSVQPMVGSATDLSRIETASVDCIVAVDAAYHFDTRADFLAEARRVLRPAGRIAWTDMVLTGAPTGALAKRCVAALSSAVGVPPANLATPSDYLEGVRRNGFVVEPPVWLTDEVLGGFARFSGRHTLRHWWRSPTLRWSKFLASGIGAYAFAATRTVAYGLFSARPAGSPD